MTRTRVKFCGMTCAEDAAMAAQLGADAVGMVFYPPAKTAVAGDDARQIARALPPFVSRVALFVNPQADEVRAAMAAARPHYLQFHGDESPAFCESFGAPYIKAFRIRNAEDIARARTSHPNAAGILLDSFSEKTPGGSGESFGWELARGFDDHRLILAGGLTAENVGDAIKICGSGKNGRAGVGAGVGVGAGAGVGVGVDVSSGISRDNDRRRKDFEKMRSFMEAVCNATGSDN